MRSTPSSPSPAELELAVSALTATCTRQIFWLEDELVGSPEAVKSCLNHGFKPQVNEKHTPQDMSVLHETGLMKIARVGHPECLQLFLSKTTPDKKPQTPADTRLRHARPGESLGTTAFERALERKDAGQGRCVNVLVTQDPLNTWVDVASTPLATPEALETMLKEAADINATNRDGKTMLFVAVNFGSHSFASALVKSGVTVGDDVLVNLADNDSFVMESTTLLEQILSSAKPPALPAKALIAAARKADQRLGVILGAIIGGKTHVERISPQGQPERAEWLTVVTQDERDELLQRIMDFAIREAVEAPRSARGDLLQILGAMLAPQQWPKNGWVKKVRSAPKPGDALGTQVSVSCAGCAHEGRGGKGAHGGSNHGWSRDRREG